MAEGMVNHFLSERWDALSAGTRPAGYVHSLAVRVMAEIGIDISDQRSKPVSEFRDQALSVVITVCDDAAENCPLWLGSGRRHHMGFPDPAEASGTEAQRLAVFREVRDGLRRTVPLYLERIDDGLKEEEGSNDTT